MNGHQRSASIAMALAAVVTVHGCGGSGSNDPGAGERIFVAEGTTIHMYRVVDGRLEELDSAEIEGASLLAGHGILGLVLHPNRPWLYAASSNGCTPPDDWCFGNGRIDRFSFDRSSLTFEGPSYVMDDAAFVAGGIACAEGDEVATGYPGQEGTCAPGGLAFGPDATRLYVDEDGLDVVGVFSVGASGDLTYLAEGGETYLHGLAAHPDAQHLYNGSNVYDVSGDMVADGGVGLGGNGTAVVQSTDGDFLVTTLGVDTVGVFDLTAPGAPAEIDTLTFVDPDCCGARFLDHTEDLGRLVIVGWNVVRTVGFDGTTLTELDTFYNGASGPTQNRGVAFVEDGALAVVAYFYGGAGAPITPGGVALYAIASDGTIAQVQQIPYLGAARMVAKATVN